MLINFKSICKYLIILIIGTPYYVFSQVDSIDIYQLSLQELMSLEAQVASFVEKDIKKQPVSVTTINHVQLELSGARTLADALSIFVPGFFTIEDQDDVIAGFRGLAPDNNSKVMLLVNGQNMNIEWFWGPPPAIFNTTNLGFIERIEVIRGPGSVTLGQGALLGVINVITKSGNLEEVEFSGSGEISYGMNNFMGGQADFSYSKNKTNAFFYAGINSYNGQQLRDEGWAKDKINEGYKGGNIINIGTRLKRINNNTFIGSFQHRGFEVNALAIEHQQDLYNFYRDRNQFGETIISITPSYQAKINDNINLKVALNATFDDFSLKSVDGYSMGGTRENRYGGKAIFNINELLPNNRLAVGAEFRRFEFGRSNFKGNNFINNVVTNEIIDDQESFIEQANIDKIWGYKSNINVISLFAEDYYSLGKLIDLFAGVRYDKPPYWGGNFSPRIGTIYTPTSNLRLRLSYQTGFRGAVGLHYGGGYREDGLLSADNFDAVDAAQIPVFDENNDIIGFEDNIEKTLPESMQGFELATNWDIDKNQAFYAVGFFNTIKNVIDVGVIWRDSEAYALTEVGTDVPGDWNGFWFFKNTEGEIAQAGFESIYLLNTKKINLSVCHSYVKVIKHSDQQKGSMYLTDGGRFKAYPENITRVNSIFFVSNSLSLSGNYLYYHQWYSPTDQRVNSNHLVNLGVSYHLTSKIRITGSCTNLLNQQKLYPMNSNVGDVYLSDGSPAIESTSVWVGLKYSF